MMDEYEEIWKIEEKKFKEELEKIFPTNKEKEKEENV
jgi:hypothetical protein